MRRSTWVGLLLVSVTAVATLAGPVPVADLPDPLGDTDGVGIGGSQTSTLAGTNPLDRQTSTPASRTGDVRSGPAPTRDSTGRRNLSEPPVTVAVRNRAAPERAFSAAVADALAYWNANGQYGAYETRFVLRENATDPDVIVWYNHTTNCEGEGSIGCAPKLEDPRVRTPIDVRIEFNRTRNRRQDTTTVIHEFGHVLGIDHCAAPSWVMGHAGYCVDAGLSLPDVDERAFPWRGSTVYVHLDLEDVPDAERSGTRNQIGQAIRYFREGANGTVPANRSIVAVDDPYRADVTITAGADCGRSEAVCFGRWGGDPDSDGAYEFYSRSAVNVAADDVEARGWYAGWALSRLLTPGEIPAVFVDASYEEIRSRWWETD